MLKSSFDTWVDLVVGFVLFFFFCNGSICVPQCFIFLFRDYQKGVFSLSIAVPCYCLKYETLKRGKRSESDKWI